MSVTCCGLMSLFCADGVQMSVDFALSAEAVRGRQRKNVPGLASATPGTFCVYFVNSNHFDVRGYQRIS